MFDLGRGTRIAFAVVVIASCSSRQPTVAKEQVRTPAPNPTAPAKQMTDAEAERILLTPSPAASFSMAFGRHMPTKYRDSRMAALARMLRLDELQLRVDELEARLEACECAVPAKTAAPPSEEKAALLEPSMNEVVE